MRNITAGSEFARTLKAVPGSDNDRRTSKLLFDAMHAAWMAHQGCRVQAEALARALPQK